jgi:arylsulfatase A-like enzyme
LNDRMPTEEITLAEALRAAGYRTAFLGKWHLGPSEEYWPEAQGFELNVGGHHRGSPPGGYFAPYRNPKLTDGPDGEHLTTRLTDEALKILQQFRDEPFLLYLSFYTVHTPLQAPPDLVEKYQRKAAATEGQPEFAGEEQVWPIDRPRRVRILQRHATYAAMVETMDTSVGRVLDQLQQLGLDDRTVVCFMSDNGGLSTSEGSPTSNLPLRGGKGWMYEGGIREPYIIRWPGVTQPGSQCDTPVISVDFYPTILDIAGVNIDHAIDGISLTSLLKGQAPPAKPRPLFWHYPHYGNQGGFPSGALRLGNYKLLERFEDGRVHLYDLSQDVGERNDLAQQMPEKVNELRNMLHDWYRQMDAKFLRAKPDGPSPWRPGE